MCRQTGLARAESGRKVAGFGDPRREMPRATLALLIGIPDSSLPRRRFKASSGPRAVVRTGRGGMSAATSRLGIMTSDPFKNRTKATTAGAVLASHLTNRGSDMKGINTGLARWDQPGLGTSMRNFRRGGTGNQVYRPSDQIPVA